MSKLLRISPDLAIPDNVVTATSVVYGGKGMGKTNLASVLVEEATKARLRWAFLDPMGVAWGLRHSADGTGPGIECVILGGPHGDIPIEPTSGEIVADLVVDEGVNTVIDFSRKASGEMWGKNEKVRFVTDYALRLFRRQGDLLKGNQRREPLLQILDEAARYIPQVIPSGAVDLAKCVGAWEQMAEEGRNVGLGVCFLTQRSARMNKSVSELADVMFAFRTIGPNSLEAVVDWLGEHIEKSRIREIAGRVRELDVGQCLVVSPGWLRVEKVVKIRPRETFDSSATPKPGQRAHKVTGKAAKPDLAKYQERMAATIEKAKAEDPKELKKQLAAATSRIRQLERSTPQQRSAEEDKRKPVVDQAAIHKAEARAIAGAITRERKLLKPLLTQLQRIAVGVTSLPTIVGELARVVDRPFVPAAADPVIPIDGEPLTRIVKPFAVPPTRKPDIAPPSGDLSRPQQRILNTLATFELLGKASANKSNVAVFSDASPTSSSFQNNLGALRSLGLIDYPTGGAVALTDAGRAVATADASFSTLDELHQAWYAKLSGPQSRILQALIPIHPEPLDRVELAEKAGASATSSSYQNNLGALRSLGLIEYGGGGVFATDLLFPEGLS